MAAVGELFLSAALQVLFDRLASPELLQFARQEGLRKQLDKWKKTLTRIHKVLDDAEEKQHIDRSVKDWLDDLRDLAYDVEDILDEVATEAALRRTLMGESQASTSKVRKFVPSWFTALTPSAVRIKIRLGSKIKKITARFNDLVTQKDQLNLKENSTQMSSKRRKIPPSTSVVTKDHIYGREEVAEAVLQLLTSDKHSDALTKVNVIPLVGMGGIGKTTLAQLVYNDKKVQNFFDMKAWACVSEDFDVVRVTKTILQSIMSSENCDGKDLNLLQVKLKEQLYGKRFLIILDDVWNENYDDWVLLRAPFEAGAPGSSIIITTRNQRVSSLMGTIKVEPFELLPTDACLSIFSQHALDAKDFSAHPGLKDIGEEIVRKCKGLPLAVKTVGGLLRSTQDRNEWDKVLKSKIWNIPEERSGIVPALMLSYHNLPAHLKRCFAYCSILPKDYEFQEKEVVLLWMAEGLIHPRQDEEEMEDLGSEYFCNLLSRSFFQKSSRPNKPGFLMHDLINDLAQSVAGETCFRMEDRVGGSQHGNLPIKARHSSYLGSKYDVTKKFEVFSKLISLRTFLPLMLPNPRDCYLARHVQCELVPTLRCLRVLSFNGYYITELSDSISDLKHLRYLNLSRTQISSLPESIATLYNLQTLLLEDCDNLKKIPSMLCNLVNLRHLNIEGTNRLEGMPVQMGKLTCLHTLSNLIVGKENCSGVKELGPLKHLKGELNISRLENVIESKDAKDAELNKKIKISALSLKWSSDIDESKDRTSELEVLNGLQPHNALTQLHIINYGGTKFPSWLTSPSFPHMVFLEISNCRKCTLLPPLGQLPSLNTLRISGMDSMKSVGSEFCSNSCAQCFRSLENLHFSNMKEWEKWYPCEEFPNLGSLSLRNCPKLLGKLPNNLPLLKHADIYNCAQLEVSLSCFPDKCTLRTNIYKGVVHGSKVTFKSIDFSRSLSPIPNEGLDMEGQTGLEWLTIKNCEELTTLWSDKVGSLPHDLPFLHGLKISNCPKLVSLVAEEVDQERLQLKITSISIKDCIALESLPKALMYNNTRLQSIEINKCYSLTHFARSHLPPTLKKLDIRDCKSMRNLVEDDDNDTNNSSSCSSGFTSLLEDLEVRNCPSLESLTSSGELPTTLQRLCIDGCPKLESVAKSFCHNLFLETIVISECENLQLLNGGELLLPSNLRELYIYDCEKLQGLQNGIYNLTSLQDLQISFCPSILSFPKQGFPINLTTLEISFLEITQALFDWGLDNLTSLNKLEIDGCQHLVSFPEMTLPASLTSLKISQFSNLECLSSDGLRKLTSLKTLWISHCENLTHFPEDGLPPSLLELQIFNCEKLRSFPKNGLPPSLLNLRINNCEKLRSFLESSLPPSLQQLGINKCPLLEEWCKKDQRGEWRNIADIPYVQINGKYIYGTYPKVI